MYFFSVAFNLDNTTEDKKCHRRYTLEGGMTHDVTRGSLASFIDKVNLHVYTHYTERQGGADLEFLV